MKFVDVKNDLAFRKIFGNEKKTQILISFLNAALKLEGDSRIKEVGHPQSVSSAPHCRRKSIQHRPARQRFEKSKIRGGDAGGRRRWFWQTGSILYLL